MVGHVNLCSSVDLRGQALFEGRTSHSREEFVSILLELVPRASFRSPLPDIDIFIRRGQHPRLRGDLHGPRAAEDREPVPGLPRDRRSLRRLPGDDLRRGQRSARLLDVRPAVLRHLDRVRRDVQHCLHFESMRDISRPLHSYQGPSQVSSGTRSNGTRVKPRGYRFSDEQIRSLGDEESGGRRDRDRVAARGAHILCTD